MEYVSPRTERANNHEPHSKAIRKRIAHVHRIGLVNLERSAGHVSPSAGHCPQQRSGLEADAN